MGKLDMNGVLKNNSVGQSYRSEEKSNIIRYQRKIQRGSISSARKSSWAFLVGYALYAGRSSIGDILVADAEQL